MACITKRRGRYVIDCYDQNGKRYRKTMKKGTTKEDARKELREIEARIERRTFVHEKKTPSFSEVAAQWLQYKKGRCRETTWQSYEAHLRNHFAEINGVKINRITTAMIEKFITNLQDAKRLAWVKSLKTTRETKQKITINTVRKVILTLNQVMMYAVRHRLIDFNPCRDAERPRATGCLGERNEIKILSPEQIKALLDAEPSQKYRTLYLTAIMTGARQGEILGLQWADVDFEKKQISINRTYNHGTFFEPKTKSSIRKIDMAPILVKELAVWKLASGGRADGLVFSSEDGTPIICHNMKNRHFFPALKAAGIPAIRFHEIRHTYASLLLAQGENVKYIQTQLGHSSPTVTLNVYSHLLKETNQEAVCRLENTIFKGTGHNLVTKEKKDLAVNSQTPNITWLGE